MKFFIQINKSVFASSKSLVRLIQNNDCACRLEINKKNCVLIIENLSSLQIVPTMSPTHFYLFIGNKKFRVSKNFYNFLRKNLTRRQISFVNIFSGAGGFTTGLINAGLKPIACFDNDVIACKTLRANHPQINVLNKDIDSINFLGYRNRVDVLVGGSPCQSFSEIGLKKGLSDKNGTALLKFIDIIFMIQPRLFIIENVKGLKTFEQGKVFKNLLQKLGEKDLYNVEWHLINLENYGIPQKRRRLFIVGTLNSLSATPFFPLIKTEEGVILRDILNNVPDSEGFRYSEKKQALFRQIQQGGCWVDLPENLQKEYLGANFYSKGGKRGILRRLSMNKPSLTLLCSPSQKLTERCHPLEERPLTIREYARVQTFEDTYTFIGSISAQYKQIGNAVPVKFARQLGQRILQIIG